MKEETPIDMFQLDKFNREEGWTRLFVDDRFRQRYSIQDGKMFCETLVTIDAEVDSVLEEFRGPWDWWHHGNYRNRIEHPDASVSYDLCPPSRFIHVHQTMHEPTALEQGGWRIHVDMTGALKGVVYFDLEPGCDGGTELVSRFSGVELGGFFAKLLGAEKVTIAHLETERGALSFPFRKGTGFIGLIERVEASQAR